jgi:hypothetical protein
MMDIRKIWYVFYPDFREFRQERKHELEKPEVNLFTKLQLLSTVYDVFLDALFSAFCQK